MLNFSGLKMFCESLRLWFYSKGEFLGGYFWRWELLRTRWGNVYLHQFVGSDVFRDPHDHPADFISIGLWGSYFEFSYLALNGHGGTYRDILQSRWYTVPWVRRFPATFLHRIMYANAWTLVITYNYHRAWGFVDQTGTWIKSDQYVRLNGLERGVINTTASDPAMVHTGIHVA